MTTLKEIATTFCFGDRGNIAATVPQRWLAAQGGSNLTTEMGAVVIPHNGTLKNLYWSCNSPNGLTASGNNIIAVVNGVDTGLQAPCNTPALAGSNSTVTVPVLAGDRVSVRVALAGVAGTSPDLGFPSNSK